MIQRRKTQAFNDGVVYIFDVGDSSGNGDMAVPKLTRKVLLRYHRRTVGLTRYYTAMQANQRVDAVIRCPYRPDVCAQDIARIEKKQYRIALVQIPEDIVPPVMDLTLERLEQDYDITDSKSCAADNRCSGKSFYGNQKA